MTASRPLKWFGGKGYLAKRIVSLFPPRDSYITFCEPYFGGGAVLFAHNPNGKSEVVNDLNGDLTNFWQVLRGSEFGLFQKWIDTMPFSYEEWKMSKHPSRQRLGSEDVYSAMCFFVRYRQSRQGLGKDFATLSRNRTRRGMNEQVSAWLSAVEGLPEAHERLKRVVVLNDDACKVIRQQDGQKTLFYCDPPYLRSTRVTKDAYEHEMTEEQHGELLLCLGKIKGRFILSGYPSPMYRMHADLNKWRRVDIQIDNKSSSAKVKEIKTECVWMNY